MSRRTEALSLRIGCRIIIATRSGAKTCARITTLQTKSVAFNPIVHKKSTISIWIAGASFGGLIGGWSIPSLTDSDVSDTEEA